MNKIIILSLLTWMIFVSNVSNAQEYKGYFGSKIYVKAITLHRLDLIPFFLNDGEDWKLYNFGMAFSATYQFSRTTGLQLEVGTDNFMVAPSRFNYNNFTVYNVEPFRAKSNYIMPKLVISNSKMQPLGLSHEIGLGFHFSTLQEGDYQVDYSNSTYIWGTKNTAFSFDQNKSTKNLSFQYALNYHIPLTKKLLLGLHFRFMANFKFPRDPAFEYKRSMLYFNINDFSNFNQLEQDYFIRASRQFQFANFGLGLCYSI